MKMKLKYGENAWQEAMGIFDDNSNDPLAIHKFKKISGGDLSYNNICDMDRLLQTITHIAAVFGANYGSVGMPFIAVGCKHGNPCGTAIGSNSVAVLKKMISGDPLAIFGGLVMTNFALVAEDINVLSAYLMPGNKKRFLSAVIAPIFSTKAIVAMGNRCVLLDNLELSILNHSLDAMPLKRYVRGGYLQQQNYNYILNLSDPDLQKFGKATKKQEDDMLLAWAIGSTSNSNTVTLVKDGQLIGNGVGQMDRVGACDLAVYKAHRAGHFMTGAVAYSDGMFPFIDAPEVLEKNGVGTILSYSGSIRDKKVIEFCEEKGIILYFLPTKKARGFFGH